MRIEGQSQPSQLTEVIPGNSQEHVRAPQNSVVPRLQKIRNTQKNLSLKLPEQKYGKSVILKTVLHDKNDQLKPSGKNDPRYVSEGDKKINRFDNIPSRVETLVDKGLNANYITIANERVAIASQYPLTGHLEKYLEMIVDQRTPAIVVLASKAEIDEPRNEMHNYFGRSEKHDKIETISEKTGNYELVDKTKVETYNLIIKGHGNDFPVKVYHVTNWPDHGTISAKATKQLAGYINEVRDRNEGVPVIHCRAGVGRTGVVICAQAIGKEISVERAVVSCRECRNHHMVQTDEQIDCLKKIAEDNGYPILKEDEPGSKTQQSTPALLKAIQSAEGKSESAADSQTRDPVQEAPPILPRSTKNNNVNREVMSKAPVKTGVESVNWMPGKIINGEGKKGALEIDLHVLKNSRDFMKKILDNRTPLMVIFEPHNETSSIESVGNFLSKGKDYTNGLKIFPTGKKIKLFDQLGRPFYSMNLVHKGIEETKITIPVIYVDNWTRNYSSGDELINLLADQINHHLTDSVNFYIYNGSSAVGDPNKLLPVFAYSQKSNDERGLIDAVIKRIK
ncbi:protein-tyrosine phosphatase family protein [Erwinia pyrifoliae]|uniref:protein-tyrosine-phosphatase n=1 Tax=Erwinia pyrifoliae TaxID=79967 RepID=A0ABY5X893_ERWPY|nr:protein-tyrosine phosphatase family protein [Erwinia pyrifoliae]UWS29310.1 dual specificity protein phosphatase family protein [Erwinia pyrifoliae]UWS33611.1 dual specificity protein phosphatase family protein [Erwinia pyrifoliae]CAY76317.1 Receptor-type tyrosine-protein phosphatase delta precursor [Erwinia pyrifoliae DSM 12163]